MRFIVIRAAQAPALTRALIAGQVAAMRPYGIDHIVQPEVHADAYLIAAELEPNVPLGGLRVEVRSPRHRLPFERAITAHTATLRKLSRREGAGLGELCGLWVSPTCTDRFLALRLVRLGLAVARALGLRNAVAFAGHHSLPLARRCGFRAEPGEPVIAYPDARYRSRIVWQRLTEPTAEPRGHR